MTKVLTQLGCRYAFLLGTVILFSACSQESFDDLLTEYDGRGPQETLHSPHPVRFSLEASFDSGMDEPQSEARFMRLGWSVRDTVDTLTTRIDTTYRPRNLQDVLLWRRASEETTIIPADDKPSRYPMVQGNGGGYLIRPRGQDPHLLGRWLSTHAFFYGYDESTETYQLEGYAKLSWDMRVVKHTREESVEDPVEIEYKTPPWPGLPNHLRHRRMTERSHKYVINSYQTLLKVERLVDVYKARYNADRSEMIISENEFLSLEKGKKYRILAINDDGGFDPKRASLADYPEAAAPMFYFAKGGNSPLPAATTFKREGSDFPNETGIVAYGMEMDCTPGETNFVHLTGREKAEFYPLSPLLRLEIIGHIQSNYFDLDKLRNYPDGVAKEYMKKTFPTRQSPYVLASSCLTQNFAYTISGVDERGVKPSFKTILRTLQAEAYEWKGSPLEGTTYEPLLIPYHGEFHGRDRRVCYLPLEPRYKELNSLDQQTTFTIPQTGRKIQGPLLADGDLYLRVYLRENDSEQLVKEHTVLTEFGDGDFLLSSMLLYSRSGFTTSLRSGFNLALAKGATVRDKAEAVDIFWRNNRAMKRYNLNDYKITWHASDGFGNSKPVLSEE